MNNELLYKGKKIGVWGLGYIGYSTMANFASKGVSCIGYDINSKKVENINQGRSDSEDSMQYWIGFDTKSLVEKGLIKATNDYNDLLKDDVIVHLICVPTEKNGEPWDEPLLDVANKITDHLIKYKDECEQEYMVVVESTISPDKVDELIKLFEDKGIDIKSVYGNVHLGAAPRRDWFVSPDKTVKTLPRIVGAGSTSGTCEMNDVYNIICDTVISSTGMKEACLVKSVENAYRHLDITFANELSRAYPDINIREVLKLVGTKWNVGTYHPSVGTGGYCIPLAPKYVLRGTKKPEELTLIKRAIESDKEQTELIISKIKDSGYKNIGILGLAYTKNIKVDILSPAKKIAKELKGYGLNVKVNDPYYSNKEIMDLTNCETFDYPDDLDKLDLLLIIDDHDYYKQVSKGLIVNKLKNVKRIIDNVGLFSDLHWDLNDYDETKPNIVYSEVGGENWLKMKKLIEN
jgi:nucleotide sugar dehydrogenase